MSIKIVNAYKNNTSLLFLTLALAVGIGLGTSVCVIGNPLYLAVGLIGLVAGLLAWKRIDYGLIVLVFMTFTRLSDVLIQYHGAPSVAKFFVPVLLLIVLGRWLLFQEDPAPWGKTAVLS